MNFAENIYRLYNKDLKQYALYLTRDTEAANDLLQDVYVCIIRFEKHYKEEGNLKAWVRKIMYNQFVSRYKKEKNSPLKIGLEVVKQVEEHSYMKDSLYPASNNEGETMLFTEEMHNILGELKPKDKKVMLMLSEDYDYESISKEVNIPIGTVKSKIHQIRKKLNRFK